MRSEWSDDDDLVASGVMGDGEMSEFGKGEAMQAGTRPYRCDLPTRTEKERGFLQRLEELAQQSQTSIPGLEHAAYERFGSVHRNTFVNAPVVLDEQLQLRGRAGVWLAGLITGVEGYVESAACGLCVGAMLGESLQGGPNAPPSDATALGALLSHLRRPSDDFQPSNVVWSMFAPIEGVPRRGGRKERRERLAARALAALEEWSVGYRGPVQVAAVTAEVAQPGVAAS